MSSIPERPALEGLEAKWEPAGRPRHLPVRSRRGTRRGKAHVFSVDTPPPTASGSLHIGHVFSYTHMDLVDALPADARQAASSTRWAGTTTACPPSAACRTTTACAATRPCRTTRRSPRRSRAATTRSAKAADQVPISRRNFIELCERLTARGREAVRGPVAPARPQRRLVARPTARSARSRSRSPSARSCTTSRAARPTRPMHRRSGTSPSAPPSRRPNSRTRSSRRPTTGSRSTVPDGGDGRRRDRDHAAGTAAGVRGARGASR